VAAFSNLKKICENHLNGRYRIEVIDLAEQPQLSKGDQILAIPTPVRRLIGNLLNTTGLFARLDLDTKGKTRR